MNAKIFFLFLMSTVIVHVAHAMEESYQDKFDRLYNEVHAYGQGPAYQKELLEEFIDSPDFNIAFASNDKETILSVAVKNNQAEIVQKLLSMPDNERIINQPDSFGNTPLLEAVTHNNEKITTLLLAKGANPNIANNNGTTPLYSAAKVSSPKLVNILLKRHADLNIANNNGAIPLHEAAKNASPKTATLLLNAGSEINKRDNLGNTPLYVVLKQISEDKSSANLEATVALLLEKGAEPNQPNRDGFTPLHRAVALQSPALVKLLLKYGADPLKETMSIKQIKKYNPATKRYDVQRESEIIANPLEMAKKIAKSESEFTQAIATIGESANKQTEERLEKGKIGNEIFELLQMKANEIKAQIARIPQRPFSIASTQDLIKKNKQKQQQRTRPRSSYTPFASKTALKHSLRNMTQKLILLQNKLGQFH